MYRKSKAGIFISPRDKVKLLYFVCRGKPFFFYFVMFILALQYRFG